MAKKVLVFWELLILLASSSCSMPNSWRTENARGNGQVDVGASSQEMTSQDQAFERALSEDNSHSDNITILIGMAEYKVTVNDSRFCRSLTEAGLGKEDVPEYLYKSGFVTEEGSFVNGRILLLIDMDVKKTADKTPVSSGLASIENAFTISGASWRYEDTTFVDAELICYIQPEEYSFADEKERFFSNMENVGDSMRSTAVYLIEEKAAATDIYLVKSNGAEAQILYIKKGGIE